MTLRSGPLERPERYMADTTKAAKLDAFENISKKETHANWLRGGEKGEKETIKFVAVECCG